MASMSRTDLALTYAKRFKDASDVRAEAEKIKRELEVVVWSENNEPIPRPEKLAILEKTKQIILTGMKTRDGHLIVEAGDNSGIIDVIDGIERDIGKGNE